MNNPIQNLGNKIKQGINNLFWLENCWTNVFNCCSIFSSTSSLLEFSGTVNGFPSKIDFISSNFVMECCKYSFFCSVMEEESNCPLQIDSKLASGCMYFFIFSSFQSAINN